MMSRHAVHISVLTFVLVAALVAVPAALADDAVCQGFTKEQKIQRFAGPNTIAKLPVNGPADLAAQLEAYRGDLEGLLADRGLGHLMDDIIEAARSGDGLSERDLETGETFEWMAFRDKEKMPTLLGPVCLATKKATGAYVIKVMEVDEAMAKADCSFSAELECPGRKIRVGGVASGTKLMMTGPAGTTSEIEAGTVGGDLGGYMFTAEAEVPGTKTVTTHTFIIPKVCLNLSYAGKTMEEKPGEPASCRESKKMELKDVDCVPEPRCSLDVPAEIVRKETFTVGASGEYDQLVVKVKDADGNPVEVRTDSGQRLSELTSFPASIYLKKAGTYTFEGAPMNARGTGPLCTATATLTGPVAEWTLRIFGLTMSTDDDELFSSRIRPNGVSERSSLRLDGGTGLGVDVEYRLNHRIGIQGSLIYAELDSSFILDLNNDWERDTDSSSYLSLSVGPNFHLLSESTSADLYLGLFVGWADVGDASYTTLGEQFEANAGSETLFGALLGLDIPFGSGRSGLHLGARWVDLTLGDDDGEIDANPLIGEVGYFRRF